MSEITNTMSANNDKAKCEGIGCAYKTSCGRFLRAEGDRQTWAAYYAMAGDDCDYFEATQVNGREHANA
jgi:hypothetical protein